MSKGKILFFCEVRHYGFINPIGESAINKDSNVFVHENHIVPGNVLRAGDLVEYDLVEGMKGFSADNVRLAEKGGADV